MKTYVRPVRLEIIQHRQYYYPGATAEDMARWDMDDLQAIAREIKLRIPEAKGTQIITEKACVYCGTVEEYDEDGAPACCRKAVDEWEAEQQAAKAVRK